MTLRRWAVLVLAVAIAAACASDSGLPLDASNSTTTAVAGGAPPAGGDEGGAATSQPPSGGGDTGGGDGQPGSGESPGTTTPAPSDETVVDNAPPATGSVGTYAPFYLRPSESAGITIEVRSQAGAEPASSTLDHVRAALAEVSGKDVAVATGSIDGGARDWTADDLRALGDTGAGQSRDRAVLRLYFLQGSFEGDDGVLGIAVRSDMTAVFSDRVTSSAGLVGDRSRIERAVALHEIGHVLGLVDLFLDTGRGDPEHPKHSSSTASVMYWAVESSLVGQVLQGGPPTTFDDADRNDLATIRNG